MAIRTDLQQLNDELELRLLVYEWSKSVNIIRRKTARRLSVCIDSFKEVCILRVLPWRWSRLHNEELNDLYSSPNIIRVIKSRRMRWAGHVARMGEMRGAYRILVRISEGRRPLGRPRRRWEDNIKMDLQEVGWGHGLDWAGSGQEQVAGSCECGNEPPGPIKCGEFLD
jgi:hypothetical protein